MIGLQVVRELEDALARRDDVGPGGAPSQTCPSEFTDSTATTPL
ncbi:hypothetical protein [Cellulomonas soli]